ncbi:radical SAM protein [Pyrofollis japonicus]|uniref:radical SAM protein n=1 Tax=Pyrofollis japonicus TaxID=3060460 RepID=UPI00295ABA9A|nr:radical SAM protein [Pyrofollis japonicus]BEP17087.1 radical SAM protein [Pyrofollis japonicus]
MCPHCATSSGEFKLKGFDPVRLGLRLEQLVQKNSSRKYYRFRATRFYGGIATGDVVGCNLRCIFCWSGRARDDPRLGFFVDPEQAFNKLHRIASQHKYRYIRLSYGEPTIGWRHLVSLLDLVESSNYIFILETNGILLGAFKERARDLSRYTRLHVRVSIKACSPELFAKLTLAKPEGLEYQLAAVNNLADYNVSFHVALFLSYGDDKCWQNLVNRLIEIVGPRIVDNIEPEYLVLYPNTKRRLKFYEKILGIKPRIVYEP